ncbi:hypothetical protein BpHYR1_001901 [Brachionus plicatilis]|uniref:Uncharacterized protein n=1 Tax=Brachionus plicatilis TaxID=10195 RepID=A0A3M7SJ74_BRAPC|nr:hypothetical protein BpHYR1_001901 [Brachionus plicatilis]
MTQNSPLISKLRSNKNDQVSKLVEAIIFWYFDSKPLLYSSTSLTVNGTEWLSPALTYLSINSKSQFETDTLNYSFFRMAPVLLNVKSFHISKGNAASQQLNLYVSGHFLLTITDFFATCIPSK